MGHIRLSDLGALLLTALTGAAAQSTEQLEYCGEARYVRSRYTCYDGDFLCPVIEGVPTLRCNEDCYLPSMYSCSNNRLVQISRPSGTVSSPSVPTSTASPPNIPSGCSAEATRLYLSDGPYQNYFYSDCHSASHIIVTSPLDDSNLTFISPRLLVAWASGNSGILAYFQPKDDVNGTLALQLENSTSTGSQLDAIYVPDDDGNPVVGVSGFLSLNSSAALTIPILGSIRTMRDFAEGPSLLYPQIQDANIVTALEGDGASISRRWLDNVTTTVLAFAPASLDEGAAVSVNNGTLEFEPGLYEFNAFFNYPQLTQLSPEAVVNEQSQALLSENPTDTTSLSFLSYTDKLLAGTWRFLTYFGRDTMISLLLLQPILSEGQDSAVEAVIGAVLERINSTDGSVAHEETIGDYSTFLNLRNNITSTAPQYDYKMIDTDFFLPVTLESYFLRSPIGQARASDFLATAATVDPANEGFTYADLALRTAEKIMNITAPFAAPGGQTIDNLIHLKPNEIVGQWRDSTYGIGGGRIPYDVNTALVPAALRSIAALSAAGFFPSHPEWNAIAALAAQTWEDATLSFFLVSIPAPEAQSLVTSYVTSNAFPFPSLSSTITEPISFHAVALQGTTNQSVVRLMNTDDCFRLFLLAPTNDPQLSSFLNQAATNILAPFPIGLSTDAGLVVANPAYGGHPVYAANFTPSEYHGPVVWSWQLAMMAQGLHRQLARCEPTAINRTGSLGIPTPIPGFCADGIVYPRVRAAYNHLWDLIEANRAQLGGEVWGWRYADGRFEATALGALPPPPGGVRPESNVRQLWSLTFLAVGREEGLRG